MMGAPIDVCSLCGDAIPLEDAKFACILVAIASSLFTLVAYKVGLWLRK